MLPGCMATKERVLIKIKTIQNLVNTIKKRTFFEKDDGSGAVFSSILNLVLLNMQTYVADALLGKRRICENV